LHRSHGATSEACRLRTSASELIGRGGGGEGGVDEAAGLRRKCSQPAGSRALGTQSRAPRSSVLEARSGPGAGGIGRREVRACRIYPNHICAAAFSAACGPGGHELLARGITQLANLSTYSRKIALIVWDCHPPRRTATVACSFPRWRCAGGGSRRGELSLDVGRERSALEGSGPLLWCGVEQKRARTWMVGPLPVQRVRLFTCGGLWDLSQHSFRVYTLCPERLIVALQSWHGLPTKTSEGLPPADAHATYSWNGKKCPRQKPHRRAPVPGDVCSRSVPSTRPDHGGVVASILRVRCVHRRAGGSDDEQSV